jgi:hypothetical protein
VSVYDFVGFLAGLTGLGLALLGLLLALGAGLWLLVVLRRPGKGRIARSAAVGGLVLALCGIGLFLLAELSPFRRGVDRATGLFGLLALLLSVAAGIWSGRRRRAAPAGAGPAVGTDAGPAAGRTDDGQRGGA